jgi:hypothetical protein
MMASYRTQRVGTVAVCSREADPAAAVVIRLPAVRRADHGARLLPADSRPSSPTCAADWLAPAPQNDQRQTRSARQSDQSDQSRWSPHQQLIWWHKQE